MHQKSPEPLQYNPFGHYESHYDSEHETNGPCCVDPVARKRGLMTGTHAIGKGLEKRCRLCRFMTVLYYLADTEEGRLEQTITISVLCPPSLARLNSVTTVQGEYSVALHCTAHGKPRPDITWTRILPR